MPSFLIPIHELVDLYEVNHCHGKGTKGHPCEGDGGGDKGVVNPFNIVATVGTGTRRFLFNPKSRELVLGERGSMDDGSHASIFADVMKAPGASYDLALSKKYDQFTVHGWITGEPGKLQVIVSRVAAGWTDLDPNREVESSDALYAFAARLVGMGAPRTTSWAVGFGPRSLGDVYPDLFKKRKAA